MIENINFKQEISLGILIGLIFIVLNAGFGWVIGIPLLAFSSEAERITIQSAVAPLGEEIAFRALLPFILVTIGVPIWLNFIVNVISFLGYHFAAYGASFTAASSLFIGAGLFGATAFLLTYFRSDYGEFQVPVAAIISHAIINTWLGIKASGFVIVG